MKMSAGAGARTARSPDRLSPYQELAHTHAIVREMRIEGREPGAVANHDHVPVAGVVGLIADLRDDPAEGGAHPVRSQDGDVQSSVEPTPPVAEARLERALERKHERRRASASLRGEAEAGITRVGDLSGGGRGEKGSGAESRGEGAPLHGGRP